MKEIDVILDIQPSPDTPELIVTKQRVVAEGTALQLVGTPRQERLNIGLPRVQISLGERAKTDLGYVLTAEVANVGMTPVELGEVALVFPQDRRGNGTDARPIVTTFELQPVEAAAGPIFPGHARTYYLPMEFYDVVAHKARALRPDQFHLAAFAGDKEVGRVEGDSIRPFLDRSRVDVSARAQIAFDALKTPEKMRLLELLSALATREPETWEETLARRLDDVSQLYVVSVAPDLRAIVVPKAGGRIDLVDLVRAETLKQFTRGNGAERRE